MIRQNHCFAFRLEGVTAAFEERDEEHSCLLRSLTNTRPIASTVVVQLQGGQVVQLGLRPFQKLQVYPPLVMAGGVQSMCDTFSVESGQRGEWDQWNEQG